MRLILRRVASRPDGTAGVLLVEAPFGDLPLCVTLEDPWRNNAVGESCIPAGTYRCAKVLSLNHGWTYQVLDVPGRGGILFHAGNPQVDNCSCILLGFAWGAIDDRLDIRESRVAFAALMEMMRGSSEFELRIEDRFHKEG